MASIARVPGCPDNWPMMVSSSPWQRRIQRAQDLAQQHPFAAEILEFYIHVARFQEDLYQKLSAIRQSPAGTIDPELIGFELQELSSRFGSFLSFTADHGPQQLSALSRELRAGGQGSWAELLNGAWTARDASDAQGFLAIVFLQPYAERLRAHASPPPNQHTYAVCPFCSRRPGVGVLRPQGEGAARSLICFFCQNEWPFRRLVCPGCGEEDDKKLPVFTASDFDYIRVECCDACKTYIKTVDLTKNGRAEPVVDELASIPLDLWAQGRGYAKLQRNLMGL